MKQLLATAALVLAAHLPASAAVLVGATPGPNTVTDYSADGLVSFDLDLANGGPVRLDFALSAADVGATIDFDAIVRNFIGSGLSRLFISLGIADFDAIGTVTRTFGGSTLVELNGSTAYLQFDSPEFLDVFIGDPLGSAGATDWRIDTGALNAGDVLSITIGIPEPDSRALLLAALLALGWTARRRHR
ncbi:PEP-CTERM sorting domain-containing protein [Aquincola sp. S2]|uniref:PEP-CTERM sorting domain-containing protein n=1 Tax=Pseudaquabacterium terrae TaxID=2732868 RepID=A0ABX2EAY2_9BURK|nr:PEP-CTERM sorting domain-containing protein [Aquabacterium terrae]NRF65902.1 PEP-CTERM sorting domain-containing protein [Aquabacterium terrae]